MGGWFRRACPRTILLLLALIVCWAWDARLRRGRKDLLDPRPAVVIDPGHPSESNSGRTVQNGATELEINWQVAVRLEALLSADGRIRVLKTRRTRDQYLRNRRRALFANAHRAHLSLHLHCDAGPGRGFTVYFPDRQGRTEGKTGPSPEVIGASREAAIALHGGMAGVLRGALPDRGLRGESHTYYGERYGGLTYSVFSEVPTVTVEMVFLSSRADARFIRSPAGQRRMAEALAAGVRRALARPAGRRASPVPEVGISPPGRRTF